MISLNQLSIYDIIVDIIHNSDGKHEAEATRLRLQTCDWLNAHQSQSQPTAFVIKNDHVACITTDQLITVARMILPPVSAACGDADELSEMEQSYIIHFHPVLSSRVSTDDCGMLSKDCPILSRFKQSIRLIGYIYAGQSTSWLVISSSR